jgi:signal transduction histidine kinase
MVNFGWDARSLEKIKSDLPQHKSLFNLCIQCIGASSQMMSLVLDVQQATERISKIVRAMKSYTYLDQAPLLEVDVHEGLENTLVILQHKLKQGVTVKRDYAPNLPRIEAYASELNQVWTNIIDNAVDAMGGKGEITLRTRAEDNGVIVEIIDNGPGIPEEIRLRIFEPFFTTKPPGSGHRGQLMVESKPGETKFKVILPGKIS